MTDTTPIQESELRALVGAAMGSSSTVVELVPAQTVRTFRVGDALVRIDVGDTDSIEAEVTAMRALASAVPDLAPELTAHGRTTIASGEHPYLIYPWLRGNTLSPEDVQKEPERLGRLLAALHGARVFDLRARFERRTHMTLMETFKRVTDQLRAWMLSREADGLSQDLLTLTLSDLQRSMREYAIAQDHLFKTARRRVLIHGSLHPRKVIRVGKGENDRLYLVGFDAAALGDASQDLASFAVAAGLSGEVEDRFLHAYLDALDDQERSDPRFLLRYFARRHLTMLSKPIEALALMGEIKAGRAVVLGDPVVNIEELHESTYEDLVTAINGLGSLLGNPRPVSLKEVRAMGRLVAYEEVILQGRSFRLALFGLPYAGKTEVGSTVARRLGHVYLNTSVLSRALALVERRLKEAGGELPEGEALVDALFAQRFRMEPSPAPPYYAAYLGSEDITLPIHADVEQTRGAELLERDDIRVRLKECIAERFATEGVVVEGHYAMELTPGRTRTFHLVADPAVRRARLVSHRRLTDETGADELLASLDERTEAVPEDAVVIDAKDRPAATAALEILWHLLPPGRRPDLDEHALSGRGLMYAR